MSNDYIFFDDALCDEFVAFASARGLVAQTRRDAMEGIVAALPDDLDDELDDALEDEYARLMEIQRDRTNAADGDHARNLMGVAITLPDGQPRVIRLGDDVARMLNAHFTPQQIHDIVRAVAASALDPHEGPLCRRD